MDLPLWVNGSLGLTGVVVLFVLSILFGYLVPVSVVKARIEDKDKAIDMWKSAYERSLAAHDEKDRQIRILSDAATTTTHVMEAVREAAQQQQSGRSKHAELAPAPEDG
jgi:hypothetical protein